MLLKKKELKWTMITKEVNEWIRKVEQGNYSSWDIMEEFTKFHKYLTKEEVVQIKNRLEKSLKH
mgnify:CR=1 FL=1